MALRHLLLALLVTASPAAAQDDAAAPVQVDATAPAKGAIPKDAIQPEGVLLRLDSVDIAQVIDLYSRITDRIVLPVPDLKGKITIINRKRIPAVEAARLIEGALELQGWSVIPQGKVAKLVKSKDAVKRLVPTTTSTDEAALANINRIQTHLITLRWAKADDVKNLISPLLSNEGTIQLNERTNLLVVTEVGTNMSRLLELIAQVDRPLSTAEESVESVPLRYVAPKKMQDTIKEYFKATTLRFLPDERLQILVLTGKQQDVRQAVKLISQLDRPVPRDQTTNQIIRIQYAKAPEVAALVEKLYKGRADPPPPTFSVNADKDTNSLILTGPPELRDEIAALIQRIDIRYQQVMLKVLIGELRVRPQTILGFQWARFLGMERGRGELAQDFGGIGLSADRSIVRTSTAGIRYSLLRPGSYTYFINALTNSETFNTLASPHITVSNNKPAQFIVGSRVPVLTSERISTGNDAVRNTEYVDVGLTLKATPSITPGREVSMDLEFKFSEQGAQLLNQNPVFTNRETKTSVIVRDDHTLVIGGLMRRDRVVAETKIPLLGDAPVIGPLFRRTDTATPKNELLVLLTPTILETAPESDRVAEAYKDAAFSSATAGNGSFRKDFEKTLEYMEDLSRGKDAPIRPEQIPIIELPPPVVKHAPAPQKQLSAKAPF